MEDFRQTAGLLLQIDLAALDPAHVQNVIDQTQQMVARGHDLFQILLHLILSVDMGDGQSREADNGIHGRADIMRHVGEEHRLCLAGLVGLRQGILQKAFLLHLASGLLVHAVKAQHHAMAFVPRACPHDLHLKIFHSLGRKRAVVHTVELLLGEFLPDLVPGAEHGKHLLILLVDEPMYIHLHALVQRTCLGEYASEQSIVFVIVPQTHSLSRVQIIKADQIIIHTQRLNQLLLTPFLLPLLILLLRAVQQKTLVKQLAVLLNELDVSHNVQQLAALMAHPIFHPYTVAVLLQPPNMLPDHIAIFIQNSGAYHMEAFRYHLLRGFIAQQPKGSLVDAEDPGAVQAMTDHPAVHGREHGLQSAVLVGDLLFIAPLLRHVHGYPHGSHNASVNVIQR